MWVRPAPPIVRPDTASAKLKTQKPKVYNGRKAHMHNLHRWVGLLTGRGLICDAYTQCISQSCGNEVAFGGTRWHMCQAPQPPAPCVVVSIGIGGEWEFESGLRDKGCEVHAFDPTIGLREAHASFAAKRGIHFHFLGLGAPSASQATTNEYGTLATSVMRPLDQLIALALGHRRSRRVTVLKIDCEGCEVHPSSRPPTHTHAYALIFLLFTACICSGKSLPMWRAVRLTSSRTSIN